MSASREWKDKPVKYRRDKVVDQLKYNLANNHSDYCEAYTAAGLRIHALYNMK